jgi:hypothetical protein
LAASIGSSPASLTVTLGSPHGPFSRTTTSWSPFAPLTPPASSPRAPSGTLAVKVKSSVRSATDDVPRSVAGIPPSFTSNGDRFSVPSCSRYCSASPPSSIEPNPLLPPSLAPPSGPSFFSAPSSDCTRALPVGATWPAERVIDSSGVPSFASLVRSAKPVSNWPESCLSTGAMRSSVTNDDTVSPTSNDTASTDRSTSACSAVGAA